MKILIFSDSHGNIDPMMASIEAESPDAIIHLGDHITDVERLGERYPQLPIYSVLGNTDRRREGEWTQHIELSGKRILLTHGHTFLEGKEVKTFFEGITNLFRSAYDSADIILFGHTHEPFLNCCNGKWIMNPGCASETYGVLKIEDDKVQWRVQEVGYQHAPAPSEKI
jgi:putative phosphoesterase